MFTYSKKCILLVSVFCLGLMGLVCGNGELAKSSSIRSTLRKQEIAHIPKESRMVFDIRNGKNGVAPMITLNNGQKMPVLGIGTYSLTGQSCINSVYTALHLGYRKIDSAYMYHNEAEIGKAVNKAVADGIVKREEVFVATKLYPNQFSDPEYHIEQALKRLDIGYIDLMLLHHPGDDDVKAYKAMEKYVKTGKIRALGLSNYYIKELPPFLKQVNIKPVLVQNEVHPYYQDRDVVSFIQKQDIAIEGWYPLGGRGFQKELLQDKTLVEIAKEHNKSVAQIILRWDLQNGVVVVPGSSNPAHIKENISVFDFELSKEEMQKIDALNRNEKHDWY